MSTEQNKALVHHFFEEFSTSVVDELFVPNYNHHDPGLPLSCSMAATHINNSSLCSVLVFLT